MERHEPGDDGFRRGPRNDAGAADREPASAAGGAAEVRPPGTHVTNVRLEGRLHPDAAAATDEAWRPGDNMGENSKRLRRSE